MIKALHSSPRQLPRPRAVGRGAAPNHRLRSLDLIDRLDAMVAARLSKREQTVQVRLDMDRAAMNAAHMPHADLIAACIVEISDLSQRRSVIEVRMSEASVLVSGSNPINLPAVDMRPDAVVLDHAEAAGLPVRLAWEQCIGPQLMIALSPGGFKLSRGFRLAVDAGGAVEP
jgi:hypothetical protein